MHSLIVGRTASGKTCFAKTVIHHMRQKGIKSLVLDPLRDGDWNADYQTHNGAEFLKTAFAPDTMRCLLVVDESGQAVGRHNPQLERIATQSRHKGHQAIFCVQQVTQLSPVIRDNCETLILFASNMRACETLADQYGRTREEIDAIRSAATFEKGQYLRVSGFGSLEYGNIFDEMKRLGTFRA